MNDWNSLENQLASWTPRRPSPRLKARLFPERSQALAESPSPFDARWAWLAPVMGCFLMLLVISGSRTNQMGGFGSGRTTNLLATVASNPGYAAYIVAGFHSEQNSLQKDLIEWTNGARVSDEPRKVLRVATNSLIR